MVIYYSSITIDWLDLKFINVQSPVARLNRSFNGFSVAGDTALDATIINQSLLSNHAKKFFTRGSDKLFGYKKWMRENYKRGKYVSLFTQSTHLF